MLQALRHLWKLGKTGLAAGLARINDMIGDRNIKTVVLFYLAFANVFINLYSAITQGSGNKFLLALESIGVTLGGSWTQLYVGLNTIVTPEVGIIKWLTGLLTILLGASTIYYWYRGNYLFIDWISANDARLTDHIYITLVMVLAVVAFADSTYFFEVANLTGEIGVEVANSAQDVAPGEAVNTTAEAAEAAKESSIFDFFS